MSSYFKLIPALLLFTLGLGTELRLYERSISDSEATAQVQVAIQANDATEYDPGELQVQDVLLSWNREPASLVQSVHSVLLGALAIPSALRDSPFASRAPPKA